MILLNNRNGIISLANARRDANISRNRARDQYESDVADFKDARVREIENDFMSTGGFSDNPVFMQSPLVEELPSDMIVPPMPDEFSIPFNPIDDLGPIENPYVPIFEQPVSGKPEPPPSIGGPGPGPGDPFDPINQPPIKPPVEPSPIRPPDDPPFYGGPVPPPPGVEPPVFIPPDLTPPPEGFPIIVRDKRPFYEPPTSFESGVPAFKLPSGLSIDRFGRAPGDYGRPEPTPLPPKPIKPIPKPEPPIFCFVRGTKVDMANGTQKPIENIKVGDIVLAQDNASDVVSYVHDIPKDNRNLWTINDRITATDAHAFLTEDGWKSNNSKLSNTVYNAYGIEVKDLQVGDKLITKEGVEEVTKLENSEAFVKVYNFTTSSTHTYLVDGVVSHNKQPPIIPRPLEPVEKKFGGRLNKGIMRLPQSQQGDIMTTRIFQNAFKPRR
tara:strand:+ start:116 stop:1435 length:1320 start_codon:yes stop_codon:yes gene_type:complete